MKSGMLRFLSAGSMCFMLLCAVEPSLAKHHHHKKQVDPDATVTTTAGAYNDVIYTKLVSAAMELKAVMGTTDSVSFWRSDFYYKTAYNYKHGQNLISAVQSICAWSTTSKAALLKNAHDLIDVTAQRAGYEEACSDLTTWSKLPVDQPPE